MYFEYLKKIDLQPTEYFSFYSITVWSAAPQTTLWEGAPGRNSKKKEIRTWDGRSRGRDYNH